MQATVLCAALAAGSLARAGDVVYSEDFNSYPDGQLVNIDGPWDTPSGSPLSILSGIVRDAGSSSGSPWTAPSDANGRFLFPPEVTTLFGQPGSIGFAIEHRTQSALIGSLLQVLDGDEPLVSLVISLLDENVMGDGLLYVRQPNPAFDPKAPLSERAEWGFAELNWPTTPVIAAPAGQAWREVAINAFETYELRFEGTTLRVFVDGEELFPNGDPQQNFTVPEGAADAYTFGTNTGFLPSFTTRWWDNVRVTSAACPPDLDGDGGVGSSDLATVLAAWGGAGEADLDGSGVVDAGDLAVLLAAWGPCP